MSDLDDKLPRIPAIMRKKGWKTAAALMQKWFDGPPSDDRSHQVPDTADVKMDWVLGFPRAQAIYDKLVSDRVWANLAAQHEISHMLHSRRQTLTGPLPIGDLSASVVAIDTSYINERSVVSALSDPLDDLFGALGSFNLRVAVQGVVTPKSSSALEITLTKVGIYVHDSYDFQDDHWYSQPLGFWKFDGDGDVGKLPGWNYYGVYNSSFRAYRAAKRRGGDFWIYSDVKVLDLHPPDTFMVTP